MTMARGTIGALARDIMTSPVVVIPARTTLSRAIEILAEHQIAGAPVVDELGRPIGILTESDLLVRTGRGVASLLAFRSAPRSDLTLGVIRGGRAHTVEDAMTTRVVTAPETTPVMFLIDLMVTGPINRIPITGPDGRVVGIVTRSDVLRLFAAADREEAR